jgi:large subunit ribosomal protein L13
VVRQRQPIRLVEEAVRGMLPKTKLGDAMYRKLKVYAGPEHPHAAQQPKTIEVA